MRQVFQAPACHTHTQLLKQSPKDLRALFLFCFICLSRAFGACQLQVSVSFELGVPGRLGDGPGDGVSDLLGRLEQYPEGCNGKALWLGHRRGTQAGREPRLGAPRGLLSATAAAALFVLFLSDIIFDKAGLHGRLTGCMTGVFFPYGGVWFIFKASAPPHPVCRAG